MTSRRQPARRGGKNTYAPVSGLCGYAILLGLVHPGWFWGKARSEIDAIHLGDMEILTCPGQLDAETLYGGIETPEGQDFAIAPVEEPALIARMRGKINMATGLADDEIGYIIPKSQRDTEPPYAYGRTDKPQYGEENSGGPDVAPAYHREALAILDRLHRAVDKAYDE